MVISKTWNLFIKQLTFKAHEKDKTETLTDHFSYNRKLTFKNNKLISNAKNEIGIFFDTRIGIDNAKNILLKFIENDDPFSLKKYLRVFLKKAYTDVIEDNLNKEFSYNSVVSLQKDLSIMVFEFIEKAIRYKNIETFNAIFEILHELEVKEYIVSDYSEGLIIDRQSKLKVDDKDVLEYLIDNDLLEYLTPIMQLQVPCSSALQHAVKTDKLEFVSEIIRYFNPNSRRASDQNTGIRSEDHPLFLATKITSTDIVLCYLLTEQDVNEADSQGTTALHIAIVCGNKDAAKRLLLNGANISAESQKYGTPMECANNFSQTNIVALLLTHMQSKKSPRQIAKEEKEALKKSYQVKFERLETANEIANARITKLETEKEITDTKLTQLEKQLDSVLRKYEELVLLKESKPADNVSASDLAKSLSKTLNDGPENSNSKEFGPAN